MNPRDGQISARAVNRKNADAASTHAPLSETSHGYIKKL
ncbi:hypothetical protein CPTD_01440 [Corynebacterium pseudotuberculosis]|nr:Hypothetical protein Cp3995_1299 [Corynebacterium pseudotuberculosis 3/99-5]AIG07674.1 hypothetical protein CPTA_01845 [Corynebacterium pseudotuberculosis]AIG09973.1 hypothetical protein CPTB_01917 [Corynebacterium pseudotuberculosis]AIG12127.1 hypothetical protein CPTC_01839 [Corynebacterium pseudotuberculosis]KEX87801.1 hypothetical protein CPTD_01440 [Corynebacterium pseudotuberculosis]